MCISCHVYENGHVMRECVDIYGYFIVWCGYDLVCVLTRNGVACVVIVMVYRTAKVCKTLVGHDREPDELVHMVDTAISISYVQPCYSQRPLQS